MEKENPTWILEMTDNDREALHLLCHQGRGEYVAGYVMGLMFKHGELKEESVDDAKEDNA